MKVSSIAIDPVEGVLDLGDQLGFETPVWMREDEIPMGLPTCLGTAICAAVLEWSTMGSYIQAIHRFRMDFNEMRQGGWGLMGSIRIALTSALPPLVDGPQA